jgi:hypothetical protein
MAPEPLATPATRPDDRYAEACEAWRRALGDYLRLAREGAGAARLAAAAHAVHAAALRKGRLARPFEDCEH